MSCGPHDWVATNRAMTDPRPQCTMCKMFWKNHPAMPEELTATDELGDKSPPLGTPVSQLSGRPGHPGFEKFKAIAASWGYD